jgi:eukaryotic-like serine/threonine-protein kinase
LPGDLLRQTCKRIGIVALVFALMWFLGFFVNLIVVRIIPGDMPRVPHWPVPGAVILGIGLAMSLTMMLIAGKLHDRPSFLLNVGLVFEVLTAFLLALLTQWQPQLVPLRISWVSVIILVYPAIVPNTPGKTFAAAFAAASMEVLAFGIAVARGVPIVGPGGVALDQLRLFPLVWMFLPNYISAILAVIPAHIIRGLGKQVSRARELGSYNLGESLGSGGMGEVYRAEHRLLARPAAIKLIRPPLIGASTAAAARVLVERFRREAEAAAVLRSPHTIELYDFGVADDGTFYYVMELLDGVGFEELVERFGPVPAERAVHLVLQACDSLAEAHGHGLIHRDIKPSNLFTCRLGMQVDFVKVLDFGLVKAQRGSAYEATVLTAPEVTTGTPAFMAPEVAMGEEDIDPRSDVYSLGAVLFWLVTGELVFEASNPIKMMYRHIQDEPPPPSRRTELPVPRELDNIILACLAKSHEDRPASAAQLADRLAAISFHQPWSTERARRWWDSHLPTCIPGDAPCNQGALVPALVSE